MKTIPIWEKLYFDQVYTAAARIIGYGGCDPFTFFDTAKKLPFYDEGKFRTAMFELTRYDRREASPPRYELNAEAQKWCFQLLGPPPEHPHALYLRSCPFILYTREEIEKWQQEQQPNAEGPASKKKRTKKV